MNFLPQLTSGASVQFPVRKKLAYRTITNNMEDGSQVKLVDICVFSVTWQVVYRDLSDQELQALVGFFESVEGRLLPFTFFDPASNLLGWSDTLDQPAWQYTSLLTVSSLIAGPDGSQRGNMLSNFTGGELSLAQEISLPGLCTSSFSLYARSDTPQILTVRRSSGGHEVGLKVEVNTLWNRYILTSNLESAAGSSVFSLVLEPNTSVDIFGLQVDAQPFASPYVSSIDKGGIYEHAHFDMDEIPVTFTSVNRNDCTLHIIAPAPHANNL